MKIYIIIFLIACMNSIASIAQNNYVTINKKKFMLNNNEFYPVVLNYGVNIVWDGNTGHYIAPTHGTSSNDVIYTCGSASACSAQIWNDLYQIKQMGFNTIRLVGLSPIKEAIYSNCNAYNMSGLSVKVFDNVPTNEWWANMSQSGIPYNKSNISQTTLFNLISQVLSIASDPQINLKVILLAGGGDLCQYQSRIEFKNFFASLASTLSSNTALMAYDLYNEPSFFDGSVFNKQTVCTTVTDWYDAVKTNDPNHLVTIGLTDAGTIEEWDPGILKIDFPSFHLYPNIPAVNHDPTPTEITNGFNRVLSQIYWIAKNINSPWIIGETGFLGSDDGFYTNSREGTEVDQKNYFQQTIDKTRDCGGSGYSYFWFQDSGDYTLDPPNRKYNLVGLVYRDGDHTTGSYILQDPYYGTFANYNSVPQNQCTQTINYLNPHPEWTSNHTYGYLVDIYNAPIKDAVVAGWSQNWTNSVQSFTDAFGRFDLYNDGSTGPITIVRAAAIGSNVVTNTNFNPGNQITLNISSQHQSKMLIPETVTTTKEIQTYKNIVKASGYNYIVDGNGSSGGNVTFKAGGEIILKDGFEVRRGGTFYATFGIPVPNCNDAIYNFAHPDVDNLSSTTMPSEITRNFVHNSITAVNKKTDLDITTFQGTISINPNPTINGITEIYISNIELYREIRVIDVLGQLISKIEINNNLTKIDLHECPIGIYCIELRGNNITTVKKLIRQ